MHIHLKDIGKRYNQEWIFRKVNFDFSSNNAYAILGANGSGKSTLLQLITGSMISSEGTITYTSETFTIEAEKIFRSVSIASPYLELIEEFTLNEMLTFHSKFKPFINNLSCTDIISLMCLEKSKNKELKYFSSGMKQRVRLALAILSDTAILLLDEPISNLDKAGIDWYAQLINSYTNNRITIVCSNQQIHEYAFCKEQLNIEDYKFNN